MNATGTASTTLSDELNALVPVALRGLGQMLDERSGLFSHKTFIDHDGTLVNREVNPLYTGACVIGLLSIEAGRTEPYVTQTSTALDALVQTRHEHGDPAVLATALWGCALAARPEMPQLADALLGLGDPRRLASAQLGLVLAGLARWMRLGGRQSRQAVSATRALASELERRYLPRACVFAATRRPRNPALARMTSFASQVYPVLGLCELAEATGTAPPAAVRHVCDFLVRSQGELGQWWWFYSTRAPQVIEGYPVYSVHQDAMAVMALLPATRLLGRDYTSALVRGLRWISGQNELGQSLVDRPAGLIYRSIQRRRGDADGLCGWSRPQRAAAYLAALSGRTRPAPGEFEVLKECRSYHLGWLLLAAAMAAADARAPAVGR
ncbi:MAG: hypothetical protein JO023_23560 [Chloroflexi bacterium]|nr:hypothetical protein [Chloroflexota bacterium]